ncbi:MAG: hypothetical protein ACJ72Z_02245 [Pyrinomonadaceae bacterium]
MKKNIRNHAFIAVVLTAITFTLSTFAIAQKHDGRANNFRSVRSIVTAGITSANRMSYRIGTDFAMAIDDAKTMKDDNKSFNFTIVDLVYLIDELEGQSEAGQLQALLKGVIRGSRDLTAVSREIATISNSYLSRQAAEQKWYFNVGTSQMNLMMASWTKDSTTVIKYTTDLQSLVKTAPLGTPPLVLESIKGLSKYAGMTLTVNDYSDLVEDAKMITTLVYA